MELGILCIILKYYPVPYPQKICCHFKGFPVSAPNHRTQFTLWTQFHTRSDFLSLNVSPNSHKNILTAVLHSQVHSFLTFILIYSRGWNLQPWPPLQLALPPPWQARACSSRAMSSPAMSTSGRHAWPCASLPVSPQPAAAYGEYSAFGSLLVCSSWFHHVWLLEIFMKPCRKLDFGLLALYHLGE